MQISALSNRLQDALLSFAWNEWAQMGVFADARQDSPWAQDPEALLVFTFEVARADARLFDEVLDWFVTNRRLISTRRLRAICVDDQDRRLVDAALQLATGKSRQPPPQPPDPIVPLFLELSTPGDDPDEAFLAHGFLRPKATPSGKSSPPDLRAPINLAFRLRELLGVGARSEVMRCLLTVEAPRVTGAVLVRAAAFAKPNVYEATSALRNAGVVSAVTVGNEQRFSTERGPWGRLLGEPPDWAPAYRDWPQLLGALRLILRWTLDFDSGGQSDYMQLSLTRDLLEEVAPDLSYAGVVVDYGQVVSDPWQALEQTVDQALQALVPTGHPRHRTEAVEVLDAPRSTATMEVFGDRRGAYGWRLKAANGQVVATSAGTFESSRSATEAARQLRSQATELAYEVLADASGSYRWRARDPNNRIVAESAEAFSSSGNAQRAARRVRDIAGSRRAWISS